MSNLAMPKIDRKLIARKIDIVKDLKKIIKTENILYHEDEMRPWSRYANPRQRLRDRKSVV